MAMSLQAYAQNAHIKTPTRVEPDRGGLDNTPAEVSQVLFRLSRWENLEYAKKI